MLVNTPVLVGTLAALSPNTAQSFSFLVFQPYPPQLSIVGNDVYVVGFALNSSLNVTVQVTASNGLSFVQVVTISPGQYPVSSISMFLCGLL